MAGISNCALNLGQYQTVEFVSRETVGFARPNMQTKAGMSFKNNKMDFKHVLIPFCRKGWKMEIQKSKIETGNGKIRNRKFKIRMKEKPKVRHKPCEAPAYVSKSTSPNLSQALCYSRDSQEIAAGMREPRILRE